MKFSIIVPVFNTSKYLIECINSLIFQTYKNIEILLVDDGSTDDSSEICAFFAKKDTRIKYIYQENSGVSSARNKGLENATGDYIMFVDSDDFLSLNAIESVSKVLQENLFVIFGYEKYYKNKNVSVVYSGEKITNNNIVEKVLTDNKIAGFLWNKVFSKNIIKKNKIKFNDKICYSEDILFLLEYLKYVKKTIYIPKSLYKYRIRKNSITTRKNVTANTLPLAAYEILMKKYKDNKKILSIVEYKYLFCYILNKKRIKKDLKLNKKVIDKEKEVLVLLKKQDKIKYQFIKYFPKLYYFLTVLKSCVFGIYE